MQDSLGHFIALHILQASLDDIGQNRMDLLEYFDRLIATFIDLILIFL